MRAEIDDTYAEAFRSLYAEVLITARDRRWLDYAVAACTGNASSTILCDCEAGIDRYVGPGGDTSFPTPDGRPGAIVQFHVPRFRKDRVEALERSVLVRVSQNVMPCATTACFNVLSGSETFFKMGRKVAFFGDGHQFRDERFGRKVWVVPILSGETCGSSAPRPMPHSKQRMPQRKRHRRFRACVCRFRAESRRAVPKPAAGIPSPWPAPTQNTARPCGRNSANNRGSRPGSTACRRSSSTGRICRRSLPQPGEPSQLRPIRPAC
jgi:Formylmethanofuran-tetrahydromethanopterin formyltransferase